MQAKVSSLGLKPGSDVTRRPNLESVNPEKGQVVLHSSNALRVQILALFSQLGDSKITLCLIAHNMLYRYILYKLSFSQSFAGDIHL